MDLRAIPASAGFRLSFPSLPSSLHLSLLLEIRLYSFLLLDCRDYCLELPHQKDLTS